MPRHIFIVIKRNETGVAIHGICARCGQREEYPNGKLSESAQTEKCPGLRFPEKSNGTIPKGRFSSNLN